MPANTLEIKLLLSGLTQVKAGLASVGSSAQTALSGIAGFATRAASGLVALAGGFTAVGAAMKGVQFNASVERAQLGIAAIQKMLRPELFKDFGEAMSVAGEAVDLLKEKAKEAPGSFNDLVQAFQAMSGAMSSTGMSLRQQVNMVVLMSQAMSGLGLGPDQLLQESRALLMGQFDRHAMAAQILAKGNIEAFRAEWQQARDTGKMYEWLTGKFAAFTEAANIGKQSFTVLLSNLGDAFEQLAGKHTKALFDALKIGMADATAATADLDAALTLIEKSLSESGKFAELLGLGIQAGFELGAEAARFVWRNLLEWLGAKSTWQLVLNAMLTVTMEIGKAITQTFWKAGQYVGAGFAWAADNTRAAFGTAIEWIKRAFVDVLNYVAAGFEKIVNASSPLLRLAGGVSVGRFNPPTASAVRPGMTAVEALEAAQKAGEAIPAYFDNGLQAGRELLGISTTLAGQDGDRLTAWQELQRRIAETRKEIEGSKPAGSAALDRGGAKPEAKAEAKAYGSDINSTPEQIYATLKALETEFGSTAQMIARSFKTVIGGAVDGIASSLKGLIMHTMTWGQALRNIGTTIMTSVVDAITRMFAEWIVQRGIMAVKSIAFSQAEGAADAAAKAPGALMTSISSFGLAALIGTAALIGAMAAFGGFAQGGYTGAGPRDEVAGVVHRGEYVLPAGATAMLGPDLLEGLRVGQLDPAAMAAALAGGGQPMGSVVPSGMVATAGGESPGRGGGTVNVVLVDSRKEAAEYAASSEFETRIVEVIRKRRVEVGIPS